MNKGFVNQVALPCACCAALLGTQVSATPVISELFYDASGSDSGLVFVELFGPAGTGLDGMVLEGVNGTGGTVYKTISLGGVIPEDGVFVIGDANNGATLVANADLIADVDFQNGPDSVVLRNGSAVLDAVGYGSFGVDDVFAGEGGAAPDPLPGGSIARFNPFADTNDNSIDFVALEIPTPGQIPDVEAVPLPAAFWLFASGLVSLLAPRALRRHGPALTSA